AVLMMTAPGTAGGLGGDDPLAIEDEEGRQGAHHRIIAVFPASMPRDASSDGGYGKTGAPQPSAPASSMVSAACSSARKPPTSSAQRDCRVAGHIRHDSRPYQTPGCWYFAIQSRMIRNRICHRRGIL